MKQALIIGDIMVDEYLFGNVERISPEAPVPIIKKNKHEYRAGGAGNVAKNLLSTGTPIKLISIIGKDEKGTILKKIIPKKNRYFIETKRPTITKTRFLAKQQQLLRVDEEETSPFDKKINNDLIKAIKKEAPKSKLILISDYGKGMINKQTMNAIKEEGRKNNLPIFVDPKKPNFELYKETYLITPNAKEASEMINTPIDKIDFEKAGKQIAEEYAIKNVIITRGEEGMSIQLQGETPRHFKATNHAVYDVTGAGDVVIATIVKSFMKGIALRDACEIANYAAGISVEKIGTTSISKEELKKVTREKNQRIYQIIKKTY